MSKKKAKFGIDDPDDLVLWKVDVSKDKLKGVYITEHIKNKLNGKKMEELNFIPNYFNVKHRPDTNIHIIVVPLTGKCLPTFYLSNKKFAVETMMYIFAFTFVNNIEYTFLFSIRARKKKTYHGRRK